MDPATPDLYQPVLTPWRQAWRVALAVLLSAAVWPVYLVPQLRGAAVFFWVDLAVGLASFGLMFYRRRWPVTVAMVLNAAQAVSGLASGPATLAGVSLATRRRLVQIVPVALVAIVASIVYTTTQPAQPGDPLWLSLSVAVVVGASVMGWGMYIGSRRELIWTLKHRAERAEAEQELRVAQARGTERARIAREMHDVLAHRISQISMHAGAMAFREDLTAQQMRASAAVVQEKAHEALVDLRGVLGVLRDDETGEPLDAPQPTYAELPELVEEARRAGLHVDLDDRVRCDGRPMPEVVGRTVYRIVQEGMTNVRKHAPGARLAVCVSGSPEDGVEVVLRNPLGFRASDTPGAGLGLVGLAERAELRGGTLEHRREGACFVLRGWIPWQA